MGEEGGFWKAAGAKPADRKINYMYEGGLRVLGPRNVRVEGWFVRLVAA